MGQQLGLLPLALALSLIFSCGGDDDTPMDSGSDQDAAATCASSADFCDDGLFCNGEETCAPGDGDADADGCVAGVPPCNDRCDEDGDLCQEECANPDQDGDGADSVECGGSDCDDSDANRFPGNDEVCDPEDHDEDCDPTTFGFRDADGDSHPDANCCNVEAGESTCGDDCNDSRPDIHPALAEACDGSDNDCDSTIDEGVGQTFYIDEDGDGHGLPGGATMSGCLRPEGYAEIDDDCDDTRNFVHPAAPEVCDDESLDEDCDGEANPDALCTCNSGDERACLEPGECSNGEQVCNSEGRWGQCSIVGVTEQCNGLDDDCDTNIDEAANGETMLVRCFADPDDDGYSESITLEQWVCPAPSGRELRGNCPVGLTNLEPLGDDSIDCLENDASTNPGAAEMCDAMDQDCDGDVDEGLALIRVYEDLDGDEHHGNPVDRCNGYPGTRPNQTDCDETDTMIHDDAPELCDGIDSNCNLPMRPVDGSDATEDADSDGHTSIAHECEGGPLPKDDCDDGDPSDNPDEPERCGGGDNDCDGSVDEEPAASNSCDVGGATAECRSGACVVFACEQGTADCNGNPSDGCEADLMADESSCGACGHLCGVGATCSEGLCSPVVDLELGFKTTMAQRDNGSVLCWGSDVNRECAMSADATFRSTPVVSENVSNVVTVKLGFSHGCALLEDQTVQCWGDRANGRIGDGGPTTGEVGTPRTVMYDDGGTNMPLTGVNQLAVGYSHSCARVGADVWCWGRDHYGQLGDGTAGDSTGLAVQVVGLPADASGLSLGRHHSCARVAGNDVYCWGRDDMGQCGDGSANQRELAPVQVMGFSNAVRLTAGADHTCVVRSGDGVACWGNNERGQLGISPATAFRASAENVAGISGASQAWLGDNHTCIRLDDRSVSCFGANDSGQLGNTGGDSHTPMQVLRRQDGGVILDDCQPTGGAGGDHTCCLRANGAVACWGLNDGRQLGLGTATFEDEPVHPADISYARSVTRGEGHTCIVRDVGRMGCMGLNTDGRLGMNDLTDRHLDTGAWSIASVRAAAAGNMHTCALRTNGEVRCWGDNRLGQLGNGDAPNDSDTSVNVSGVSNAVEIGSGHEFSCARRQDGTVSCWGAGEAGQLGDGVARGADEFSDTPVDVMGINDAVQLYVGYAHACARRPLGTVMCWGQDGSGALGNGNPRSSRDAPVQVVGIDDAVLIGGGTGHVCALRGSGELWCWGRNDFGQLGNNDVAEAEAAPVMAITGISDFRTIVGGARHTCAARSNGELYCWGRNSEGQLGTGDTSMNTAPTLNGLMPADARAIGASSHATCTVRATGAVACFGHTEYGALGVDNFGTGVYLLDPTDVVQVP